MKKQEDKTYSFEDIVDFIEGKFTPEEEASFRAHMDEDYNFRATVNEIKEEFNEIPDYRKQVLEVEDQLFSNLDDLATEKKPESGDPPVRKLNFVRIAIAASIILATGFLIYLLIPKDPPAPVCGLQDVKCIITEEGVYQDNATMMGGGSPDADPVNATFAAYRNGQYEDAIEGFDTLRLKDISTFQKQEMTLSLAVSLVLGGRPAASLPFLDTVATYQEPRYQAEADWYRAMAFLSSGQYPQAKASLERLTNTGNSHQESAARYLEMIPD